MAEVAEGQNAGNAGQGDSGSNANAGDIGQGNQGTGTPSSLLGGEGASGTGAANGEAQGTDVKSWIESLPEDMRTNEALAKFKDPSELAKAHLDSAAKIAELEAKALKVPESADKYEITVPEGLPVDKDFVTAVKTWAHESGMSQEQLTAFSGRYMEMQKAWLAKAEADNASAVKAQEDALKIEWGAKYEDELKVAQQAFRNPKLVAANEIDYVLSRYGNDSMLVRIFNRLSKMTLEDTPPSGDGGGSGGTGAEGTDASGRPKPFKSYETSMKKK